MNDYGLSEKLFLDVWKKYGSPTELSDPKIILEIFQELIDKSHCNIVLDHYSRINFDTIIRTEYDEQIGLFKFYWKDYDNLRRKYLNSEITEHEWQTWAIFDYCTYAYMAINIDKIRFVKSKDHLFILIRSGVISRKDMKRKIIGDNETLEIEECTKDLYSQYTFWLGDPKDMVKVDCIANTLPYYVCIVQPKENIPSVGVSKKLLLLQTLLEINARLEKVRASLNKDITDRDELWSKGNITRNIMEYALKHFCVIMNIPIEIEQKYEYIDLGILRKKINNTLDIEICTDIVVRANELSHDSGKRYTQSDIQSFLSDVINLIQLLQLHIIKNLK